MERATKPGTRGATAAVLRLVTSPPTPAQAIAWRRIWGILLAPDATPSGGQQEALEASREGQDEPEGVDPGCYSTQA
jgi:hypothetical protein